VSAAIEARDVFRVHRGETGGTAALQGLTLEVKEREIVVVLGPSGSGKTSLLQLLAGLDRPSAGTVRVFGEELPALPRRRMAAFRANELGYVDQHYARALSPELRARDLVGLQLGLLGATARERRLRADELLERVGLEDRAEARPGELSGGEQQRVALCAALAHRPRLLLADEPTGELDAANATAVYRLIGGLARETGCTTLIVSHDPESAAVADRIVHVRDGRLAGEQSRLLAGTEEIVVGRGGWVRLPEELLLRAGIVRRAAVEQVEGGLLVSPTVPATAGEGSPEPEIAAVGAGGTIAALRGVGRRYGSTQVLDGLDADFGAGRLTVVTGPSGSGKTTLLNLLAGLDLPGAGTVEVLGTELQPLDRAARARFRRDHIGLVTQEPGLVPFLTARENVELGLSLRGRNGDALEALAAVGLKELADRRVERLSAGERQRVAIARATAPRPALLLADEPTARLDQANALAVARLFVRLAREAGAAVVCATHDAAVISEADNRLELRPRAG
jgi:ABC-type lipoprotein export system ATPase subunit